MSDDLTRLAHDLEKAARGTRREVEKVVTRGVINIKGDWKSDVSGLRHAPQLPAAITDDVTSGLGFVYGEVGPDKDLPQGALGNLVEYGSVNNPPNPAGQRSLDKEEAGFVGALERFGGELL